MNTLPFFIVGSGLHFLFVFLSRWVVSPLALPDLIGF